MLPAAIATFLLALTLAGCGGGNGDREPRSGWSIGPIVNGENYSIGVSGTGEDFAFPSCANEGSVNYVTKVHRAPLTGSLAITYTITGDADLITADTGTTPKIALYVQRAGDDWLARDGTEFSRWWSKKRLPLELGTHTLTVPLTREHWGPVLSGGTAEDFRMALRRPVRVGFTFGNGGAGHGVCAKTGAARFVLDRFEP